MNFDIDLTGHEIERRALVAESVYGIRGHAIITEAEAAEMEAQAWRMLYGDLDEGQQKVYDMLVEQGVLPDAE